MLDTLRDLIHIDITVTDEAAYGDKRPDAFITLQSPSGTTHYVVKMKHAVTTSSLPVALTQLEHYRRHYHRRPLLLAPYLTPAVTKRLMDERVEFADSAGNVFLSGPAAYVVILGKKPEHPSAPQGFTTTDLQLVYALLARPQLRQANYREMNAVTGVSLGKVSNTIRKLAAAGHVRRARNDTLLLTEPRQLLERWEFGYLEQLRPKLAPRGWRLAPNSHLDNVREKAANLDGVLIGGEYAADALTGYLKPASLTLHVPRGQTKAIAFQLRLAPADNASEVTIIERFVPEPNNRNEQAVDRSQGSEPLAHPILVRAELLALDDARLREVADRLLSDVILPEASDAGA